MVVPVGVHMLATGRRYERLSDMSAAEKVLFCALIVGGAVAGLGLNWRLTGEVLASRIKVGHNAIVGTPSPNCVSRQEGLERPHRRGPLTTP